MKKTLLFILPLLLLICFAGCNQPEGGSAGKEMSTPTAEGTPLPTFTPTASAMHEDDNHTEAPKEDVPYRYAVNKYEADRDGWALDYYEYETPFCLTDTILTYWTTTFYPEWLPEGGLGQVDFCLEEERITGVHIEYLVIDAYSGRESNFAVLLASDDLPDLLNQADNYYPGSMENAIMDRYLVNLYDYRAYAPNFFHFVLSHDDDPNLYDQIFIRENLVASFRKFSDRIVPAYGTCGVRGDWLDRLGIDLDSITTVEDYTRVGRMFRTEYGCSKAINLITNQIDMPNFFTCYDTYTCLASTYNNTFPSPYVPEGRVHFYYSDENARAFVAQMAEWMAEGLCDPNFMAPDYSTNPQWNNDAGFYCMTPSWIPQYNQNCIDPDCDWRILKKVSLYEGQVHKLGKTDGYYGYGSTQISMKCSNIELAVTWCDWRYSESGAFFCSYGVQGITWEYNEAGRPEATEFIYNNPDGIDFTYGMTVFAFNHFVEHGIKLIASEYCFPGGENAISMFDYHNQYLYSGEWEWPKGVTLSDEQSQRFAVVGNDLSTYITENVTQFVNLDKPLSEWDSYSQGLEELGIGRALEIYQEAYEQYLEKKAARKS
ncbi:MAG: hypothetical protein IKN89_08295 [Oscillospiraceae bacterium]|nr:hypothetical protein [Oscillospiraceae bacterium]